MYCNDEVDVDIANDDTGQLGAFYGLGVIDHIPAQNQAGNDLAAVVSQWAAAKSNGSASTSLGSTLAARARQIGATFASFARSLHNERADRGANEIEALANQIAAGIDGDVGKLPAAPSSLQPPQQTIVPAGDLISSGVTAITRTIERVIGDVIPGAGPTPGPSDYGLPPQGATSGLPDWLLPAAAGVALVLFMGRK